MGRLVFIHIDDLNAVWGNGTLLTESDTTIRPSISIDWGVDASFNLLNNNTGGSVISYNSGSGTFSTNRPVRVVIPSNQGTTNYVDLSTVNSGISKPTITSKPAVIGGEIRDNISSSKGLVCMLAWLDNTPKQSDGSVATTDGNAEYYELTILAKALDTPSDFVGLGYKSIDSINSIVSSRYDAFEFGAFLLLDPSTGGITTQTIRNVSSCYGLTIGYIGYTSTKTPTDKPITTLDNLFNIYNSFYNTPYEWSGGSSFNLIFPHSAGDIVTVEFNKSGVALVNRTTGDILKQESNSYFGNITTELFAPVFTVMYNGENSAGSKNFGIDDLGIIGFDDIVS